MKKHTALRSYYRFIIFLSGCAKQPEYNTRTALSTEVATRWGSDVHSTVKGVSAERVDSPSLMRSY